MGRGFLEQFNIKKIAGWIPNDPNVEVVLSFNDCETFEVVADWVREDLKSSGVGFIFDVPDSLVNKYTPRPIKVSVKVGGEEIGNSPQNIITNPVELNKVLIGKNGWLFLKDDTNSSIEYITGKKCLSEESVKAWGDLINTRLERCKRLGISYYHLVCPEKEVVYSQYLPEDFFVSDNRPVVKILQNLKDDQVIYPNYISWIKENPGYDIFTKGDTHWSFYGAYVACKALISSMSKQKAVTPLASLESYEFFDGYQVSDLQVKTKGRNVELIRYTKPIHREIFKIYDNQLSNTGRTQEYKNTRAIENRVIVFHTSSFDWMKPYINDSFSNVKYIWDRNINWDEVEDFQPDFLIFQSNERFLTSVPSA
jgi:hypothetical protein